MKKHLNIYAHIYNIYIQWLTLVPPPCLTFVTTFWRSFWLHGAALASLWIHFVSFFYKIPQDL